MIPSRRFLLAKRWTACTCTCEHRQHGTHFKNMYSMSQGKINVGTNGSLDRQWFDVTVHFRLT